METGRPELRHRVERRIQPERRTGLDRRIVERRHRTAAVLVERRRFGDRRAPMERRSPVSRRSRTDRRGSGIGFSDVGPA